MATPEPAECPSAEDTDEWEDRSPTWALQADLRGERMDFDFIETIFGPDILEYLDTQLKSDTDRQHLRAEIPADADTLVLIMSPAFDGKKVLLSSTPRLHYHGEYAWKR